MKSLNVLICGTDKSAMQRMAQALSDDGATVGIHHPVDILLSKIQEADFLLIDLDGLNSFVLCSLLSIIRYNFPTVPVIGISTRSAGTLPNNGFKLDACYNKVPRLKDIMFLASQVSAKYLYDTSTLRAISTNPRHVRQLPTKFH